MAKGKIQFDVCIDQMMHWNREIIIRAKDKLKELFFACDLDGNGYIELFEFHTLVSCVDPLLFDFD